MSFQPGDLVVCVSTRPNPAAQPNPWMLEKLAEGAYYRVAAYFPHPAMPGLQLVGVDHKPGNGWQAWRFRKVDQITTTEMLRRGWTRTLMKRFLPQPDGCVPVDYWANFRGQDTYAPDRVFEIEHSEEFAQAFIRSWKGRTRGRFEGKSPQSILDNLRGERRSTDKRNISQSRNFNLDYRPNSYWGPQDLQTSIGSRVKGELRRRQALEDSETGHFDPEIIAQSLTDEHRLAAGLVHPWFMGGEYLPDLMSTEVEIARIVLKSTTMDVVSIRARKTKRRIIYRIVDEYEPEFWADYSLTKRTSVKPLSMREVVDLIDNAREGGLVGSGREFNYQIGGADPQDYYDFEKATSVFYPELARWYDELNDEWLRNERDELPRRQKIQDELLNTEISAAREAAENDDPGALNALGYNYFLGRGVERNLEKAVEFWTRSSELGDPRGTFNLGVCLHDGMGVPRNQKRALELYEMLAEDRYYVGLKMAGYCRHVGIGCQPDKQKALRWYFEMAKSKGKNHFNAEIVKCLRNMSGKSRLEREVINWIRDAATLGVAGQNMLAALSAGKTEDPVKHDAGVGYLGTGQLFKMA